MKSISRRSLIKSAGILGAGFFINTTVTRALAQNAAPAPTGPFKLPPLPYDFTALEPHLDAKTLEIHHDKHHATYVANLNKAVADYPDLQKYSVEELLKNLDKVPEKIRTTVRNNAGGHANHTLYWQCLSKDGGTEPEGALEEALGKLFSDKEDGHQKFLTKALGVFGSGWVWYSIDKDKNIVLEATPNQDSPILFDRKPLLGIDLWEHAYYLKYQNRRGDYIKALSQIVNWKFLGEQFNKLTA
jgi:Fe-Mn family superoxide dismutase